MILNYSLTWSIFSVRKERLQIKDGKNRVWVSNEFTRPIQIFPSLLALYLGYKSHLNYYLKQFNHDQSTAMVYISTLQFPFLILFD